MEKFGLRADRTHKNNAIELEIAREQASALGMAGRALRLSLERYQAFLLNVENEKNDSETLIQDISDKLWALILQREFIGFTSGNLEWVRANYRIPEQAIAKMGSTSS